MFGKVDAWIERKLKADLHAKRQSIVDKAIVDFQEEHKDIPTDELRKKLVNEAARVYDFIDRSILRERIKRAKYTFWGVSLASLVVTGATVLATGGSNLAFIAPPTSGLITWAMSIATIPVSYNQRVKGAMQSVIGSYLRELQQRTDAKKELLEEKSLGNSHAAIIAELQKQVQTLSKQVAALTALHRNMASETPEQKDMAPTIVIDSLQAIAVKSAVDLPAVTTDPDLVRWHAGRSFQ